MPGLALPAPPYLALALLGLVVALFVSGRLRHDVVALIALVGTGALGLVPAAELFAGFGHPAVLTVAAVLILSAGLERAGVIAVVAERIAHLTATPMLHMAALTGVVTVASAFMNNVGALALMMPVAIGTAVKSGRAPGLLLMPMAFGALLGGMTTLMGTPPNLIIAGVREDMLGAGFGVFDFAWVGLPVALGGLVFLLLTAPILMPRRAREGGGRPEGFRIGRYRVELVVAKTSPLVGAPLRDIGEGSGISVTGLVRGPQLLPGFRFRRLAAGDVLLVSGPLEAIETAAGKLGLGIAGEAEIVDPATLDRGTYRTAEVMVARGSGLIGRQIADFPLWSGDRALVAGLARGAHDATDRLADAAFEPGDILLLHGEADALPELQRRFFLLPLGARDLSLGATRRVGPAVAIFAAAIAATLLGLASITLAFFAAILGFLAFRILRLEALYDAVDWSVIVLLGAMFPLGAALEATGASTMAANALLGLGALPLWALVAAVLVVTMLVSDVVNNAATALLMAPIALSIAQASGANPDMFLMAVAIGASCAFLTPIGHQANTLVMGPGGYRFTDYWRLGLPLEILITAIAVPMLMLIWG
ncbi:MAG: SLC13 family permease [Pseudomonadota bacterium]